MTSVQTSTGSDIVTAKAALEGARVAHRHSPSGANWLRVLTCEKTMNERLEAWSKPSGS